MKYTKEFWESELTRSENDHNTFFEEAKESIKVYAKKRRDHQVTRKMQIWWSVVNTLLPAYYSKTPKVESSLRAKSGNSLYNLGALTSERALQYVIDEEIPFDSIALDAIRQYVLTGRAVLWARYEADLEQSRSEYEVTERDGSLLLPSGEPYEGEVEEKEGRLYGYNEYEEKTGERAILECVHYKDFAQSVARNLTEVDWKARRAYLSEDDVREKFGSDTAAKMSFDTLPQDVAKKARSDSDAHMRGKAEFWEIYCEESGKVYWLSKASKGNVFEAEEPPVSFNDFYPCVEIYTNQEPDTIVPISDYTECKDLILEVERLTSRIHATTEAIRSNFLYDKNLGNALEEVLRGDLKGIPLDNWNYDKKGAPQAGVAPWDISMYVNSLQVLVQAREGALAKLYEQTAVSDLIRGATAPVETATAQQLKSNYNSLRYRTRLGEVERFFSDALQKLGEIVCEQYSEEKLYDIANGEEIAAKIPDPMQTVMGPDGQPTQQPVPQPPEQKFSQIVQVLREDPGRRYRIRITSDSLVAMDERADRQERVDFMTSLAPFLQQMAEVTKTSPAVAPLIPEVLTFVMRSYKAGKELEETLQGVFQNMVAQAQQPQQQQPDPKMLEVQMKREIAQMEMQHKQQLTSAEMQIKGQQMQAEMAQAQADNQLKLAELQIKQQELDIKREQLATQAITDERDSQRKSANEELKAMIQATEARLKESQLALEAAMKQQEALFKEKKLQLEMHEKLIEEKRLAAAQAPQLPPIKPVTLEGAE